MTDGEVYRHVQSDLRLPGVIAGLAALALASSIWLSEPTLLLTTAVFASVSLIGLSLSKLTTIVGADTVTVSFRFGWPKRVIRRSDISSVRPVRTKWWYGWGIRFIPGSTMYNVWGLDAVQLDLVDGRGFRIGTDDPSGLASALAG